MNVQILESITDAFFVLDRKWKFVSLNSVTEKLFEKSRTFLLNFCIWEEFPDLKGSVFEQESHHALESQSPTRFEAFFPIGKIWVETYLTPHQDGISVCLRNISERKSVEADLLEQSRLARLEAKVSRFLVHAHSIPESLQYCTDAIAEHLDITVAAIWLYNAQRNCLELQGSRLNPDTPPAILNSELLSQPELSLEGSVVGAIAQNRQPVCDLVFPPFGDTIGKIQRKLGDIRSDPLFCNLDAQRSAGSTKLYFVGYPLLLEERTIGVLAAWSDRPFSNSLREGLETLSDNLALDIDRCQARSALASRREALLFRLANQIRNSLDLDTILETAVREIRNLLDVDCCSYLWCWNNASNSPSLSVSHEAWSKTHKTRGIRTCSPDKLTFLARQIERLKTIRIEDIAHPHLPNFPHREIAELTNLLEGIQIESFLLIPLKTRSGHLGAIACSQARGVRPWNDSEIELLRGVVDQLALAIDQAELFAQTRATALAAQTQARELESTLKELKQTQTQLIQTEKMSSLGQMIAGIAHEINNPVNFISGNLSYTSDYVNDFLELFKLYRKNYPYPSEEIREFADDIDLPFILEDLPKTLSSMQIGAERIRKIVLSLKNFSRLDQAEMKAVDIHEGIDNTLLILQHRLKAKGRRSEILVNKKYGDLPEVECYAGQLNQVFMNILSNGIDALMDVPAPHCITITTEWEGEDESDGRVFIRIRDNGPGMSEQTRSHIFDPFFTTKPVGKGTGLGLAISYEIIVEKHRGHISCHSIEGEGTEFHISIPIIQCE
ncbi:MAG: GAF domain-containing protein [Cyanobacteria bacterium SBLK]|nr:GAF domain-containing protein [Cyanobacteria bacterium SBLK]